MSFVKILGEKQEFEEELKIVVVLDKNWLKN